MKAVKWSVNDIVEMLTQRQHNKFDGNMAVSGNRGDGKSTCINKIFYRFKNFKPRKHQVYNRDDVINLLKFQEFGLCWDDEAINTGYKRDFQNKGQQELIKILTAYRDNFNVYASAIPNFFSLDKDLRDLYFIHLHIIERGIAVIHMPLQGRLYSQDRWDSKYNAKIEEGWSKKFMIDPNFKPPYHKLSTFRGYLFFNDVTPKQQELYLLIKKEKREESFITEQEKLGIREVPLIDKVYKQLIEGKLSKTGLSEICLMEGKKYSTFNAILNRMLKDNGISKTMKDYLQKTDSNLFHNKDRGVINELVPTF